MNRWVTKMSMDTLSYEDQLGDALEQLLGEGADDLDTLASGLNKLGIAAPGGAPWTQATLAAEFKRLGA